MVLTLLACPLDLPPFDYRQVLLFRLPLSVVSAAGFGFRPLHLILRSAPELDEVVESHITVSFYTSALESLDPLRLALTLDL